MHDSEHVRLIGAHWHIESPKGRDAIYMWSYQECRERGCLSKTCEIWCDVISCKKTKSESGTFAILVRRKDRTRNLNRSSSVWIMMSRKFVLGSVSPVCSSTSSI